MYNKIFKKSQNNYQADHFRPRSCIYVECDYVFIFAPSHNKYDMNGHKYDLTEVRDNAPDNTNHDNNA